MPAPEYDEAGDGWWVEAFPQGEADAQRILGKTLGDCTSADIRLIGAALKKEGDLHLVIGNAANALANAKDKNLDENDPAVIREFEAIERAETELRSRGVKTDFWGEMAEARRAREEFDA